MQESEVSLGLNKNSPYTDDGLIKIPEFLRKKGRSFYP